MIRAAIISGLVFWPTADATAQSFEEAVKANFSLAAQLCLIHPVPAPERARRFVASGFSERVERSSVNSDTTHYFTAPADTVAVELYYGETPEFCSVTSAHLGVADASKLLDQIVPRLYPGFARKVTTGPVNPSTGQPATCVRYEDPANPIGLVIGVIAANTESCTDNGTSRLFQSYRV